MAKVNRYFQQAQAPYISQYADYKLPYEAVQNAVMQRQGTFDKNQAMLANAANKYGQIASRGVDAEGKANAIDKYLGDVNETVNNKYNGDFSLAAGDIFDKTARFTADPMWDKMRSSLEDEKAYKAMQDQAKLNGISVYETSNFSGEKSIFAEDGGYNDVNYDYIPDSPERYQGILKEFFNDFDSSKTTGLNVDALNEAAKGGENAFVGYLDREYKKFNDPYLKGVMEQYKNLNPQKYQIYKDQDARNGTNLADGKAISDILSASKEFEFNRMTGKALQNPTEPEDTLKDDLPPLVEIVPIDSNTSTIIGPSKESQDGHIDELSEWNEGRDASITANDSITTAVYDEIDNLAASALEAEAVPGQPHVTTHNKNFQNALVEEAEVIVDGLMRSLETRLEFKDKKGRDLAREFILKSLNPNNETDKGFWTDVQRDLGTAFDFAVGPTDMHRITTLVQNAAETQQDRLKKLKGYNGSKDVYKNLTMALNRMTENPELIGAEKLDLGFDPYERPIGKNHDMEPQTYEAIERLDDYRKNYQNYYLPELQKKRNDMNKTTRQTIVPSSLSPDFQNTLKRSVALSNARVYDFLKDSELFSRIDDDGKNAIRNKYDKNNMTMGNIFEFGTIDQNYGTGNYELYLPIPTKADGTKLADIDELDAYDGKIRLIPNKELQGKLREVFDANGDKFQRYDISVANRKRMAALLPEGSDLTVGTYMRDDEGVDAFGGNRVLTVNKPDGEPLTFEDVNNFAYQQISLGGEMNPDVERLLKKAIDRFGKEELKNIPITPELVGRIKPLLDYAYGKY